MTSSTNPREPSRLPKRIAIHPSSPNRHHPQHHSFASGTPTSGANRRIAIAVDLSDESAYAVKWAVQNYFRPGDAVILLHVAPTSVLYGADWGSVDLSDENLAAAEVGGEEEDSQRMLKKNLEDDFDAFTATKAKDLAHPLVDANIPFKIHIAKDHDMKERLCLEVERLGLSAMIMGSCGFGASRRSSKDEKLGSVSDYCVRHCVCPVVVVRYPEEKDGSLSRRESKKVMAETHLKNVEEQAVFHDSSDKNTQF